MLDIDISKITNEVGEPTARFVESEKDKQNRKMALVFSAIFVGIFVLGTLLFAGLEVSAKNKNEVLKDAITGLKTANAALLSVEQQGLSIAQRNRNALTLLQQTPFWSVVFKEVESVEPKTVSFSRFEIDKAGIVRINGSAETYQGVAKLLVSFNNSSFFEGASLISSSLTVNDIGKSKVEFSISLRLKKDITRTVIKEEEAKKAQEQGIVDNQ